ncbi:MAG: tetratricopeptide repeat protein [Myxococcota bacterium]|nr:tetratricopeptide repeat protein [Myxococcota bacterium]
MTIPTEPRRSRQLPGLGLAVLLALSLGTGCASTPQGPTQEEIDLAEQERDYRRAQAHYKMGIQYMRDGNPALAIRELQTAIQYDPDDSWSHLSVAEAYRMRGRPRMAQDSLERALALKPDFQQARLNLSALLIQMGKYEESMVHSDRLLDEPTFPVPWKALTNKGYAQMKLGRVVEARETFILAIEYDPAYWQAHLNLGILEAEMGNSREALKRFEQVLAVRPGVLAESEVNYRMGEIYAALGNQARAMDHLVASATTLPNGPWGKRSEDYLKRLK